MGFMFNLSVRRPCAAIWLWIALVLLLWNGRVVVSDSKYLIGLGSYDIIGPAADVNMMDMLIRNRLHLGFTSSSELAHLLLQTRKGTGKILSWKILIPSISIKCLGCSLIFNHWMCPA
ncbi:neutral ceramidase 1 [Quercus suber]|uniref:Neutral ceramidase 1 n=1 Tax=Quercus suber TaxID=58331 RepID=A0AAW0JPL0_QUESU